MRALLVSLALFIVAASHPVVAEAKVAIRGVATWYDYVPGGAAAGPALRRALGPHWRGTWVRACTTTRCVRVQLTDWCSCYQDHKPRLIDLDVRSFARLAPTWRGVVMVTVVVP